MFDMTPALVIRRKKKKALAEAVGFETCGYKGHLGHKYYCVVGTAEKNVFAVW